MKKILSLVLTCVMLLSIASLGVFADEGVTEIANAEQLAAITDGNYKLTADITATGTIASFSGTLDGNGHTITVSAPLFDTVSGTVKNETQL